MEHVSQKKLIVCGEDEESEGEIDIEFEQPVIVVPVNDPSLMAKIEGGSSVLISTGEAPESDIEGTKSLGNILWLWKRNLSRAWVNSIPSYETWKWHFVTLTDFRFWQHDFIKFGGRSSSNFYSGKTVRLRMGSATFTDWNYASNQIIL